MQVKSDLSLFLRTQGAGYLLLAILIYGIGTGILAPMNAVYLKDRLDLSKGEIASIFAISLFLNMLITLSVGIISDRLKGKKTIPMIAAVLCASGLIIYMQADDYSSALTGMSIAVAPSGLIMGQLFAMARNHFQQRAESILEIALLWLRAGYSVGFFMGLLLGANLYLLTGFQGVLWGNVAGYVGLFLLLSIYSEVKGGSAAAVVKGGEPFSLAMLIALLMLLCADAIRGLYLPLVFNERFERPDLMSYLWSGQAVFELLFMTLTGYWAAKYGSKSIMVLGGLCALITYTVYTTTAPIGLFFAVQPLYSLSISILYGVAMGYVQRMFINHTGFGASLYLFISQTASLIGYLLPVLIEGISPAIFMIPITLVVVALFIIVKVLYTEKRSLKSNALGR
ncbi:MFS transporter [Paenibacillus sp. SYP-B3998]|uniref:MFS transporter n=1 Tax=Paenibacillus sp. SYP-B3998 TaxID=2678564 RepID=A0A6G3ZRU0_9BACL|nr:MFS transporter [Paenibacillus sp. SYP-B3998]NEW04926.1 MFS transporter [Paenibacillus sp. SYP-B3998]